MKTISDHLVPYRTFLRSEKDRLSARIAALERQGCQDEANLDKIRLNIFGVFETVAAADERQSADWADFCRRYEPRFTTLTAPWRSRLSAALLHSDTQTRFAEEAKLSAANHIQAAFLATKE